MDPKSATESSRSLDGLGNVVKVEGGTIGLRGPPNLPPDMAEPARGLPHEFETEDPGRGP